MFLTDVPIHATGPMSPVGAERTTDLRRHSALVAQVTHQSGPVAVTTLALRAVKRTGGRAYSWKKLRKQANQTQSTSDPTRTVPHHRSEQNKNQVLKDFLLY